MDIQDSQDNRRSDLQFVEITEKIIGCAFEVINELGTGFLESVYEKALAIALQEEGFHVPCQHPPVYLVHPCSFILFENLCIGAYSQCSALDWH